MRIKTLRLKNFRSHVETTLELDRFNFVRGPNGCGKSSIQMALEYLFTGRCELTDAAGRGAEALIRVGEKELQVSATLESGETLCRRRTARAHNIEINGKRVPVDAAEAFLAKQFGSPDLLSAVLNSGRFVSMSESEQKRFLAQVVYAGKVDLPNEIIETMRAINEEPPRLASVADVEAAYKHFTAMREEALCRLNALGPMEKSEIPFDLPNVQEVQKKLEDLRQQKERLVAQKAEVDAKWEAARTRLKQVRAEIEELSAEILSPSQEQEFLQLESQRGQSEKLRRELTELVAEQGAIETSLLAVERLNSTCPTCRQPISLEVKQRELEALRVRLGELEELIQATKEELSEYAEMGTALSRLEAHRGALVQRAKLVEEQSKLQTVERPEGGDLESRMTILTERINKGARVLERAQQLEGAKDRCEAHAKETSSLKTKVSLLDRLTEFFGPKGALVSQVSSRIGSFTDGLNRHLAAFGYSCNLALDPFEIRVSTSRDGRFGFSLTHLSESEQFRFGVAFQSALAMVTGLRFVVMDRADVLDKQKRKLLTSLLLNSKLDQAIVLATSEEAAPLVVPQGVKFLTLTDGIKSGKLSPRRKQGVSHVEGVPTGPLTQ